MGELKEVKVHWDEVEHYTVFKILRFEVKCGDEVVGYYRIWHDPDTENIAFYGEHDKHGVLAPQQYKSVPTNHRMIRLIEEDLNKMGYTMTEAYRKITDGMLLGMEKFPADLDILY